MAIKNLTAETFDVTIARGIVLGVQAIPTLTAVGRHG
jgi:hypothetical protein